MTCESAISSTPKTLATANSSDGTFRTATGRSAGSNQRVMICGKVLSSHALVGVPRKGPIFDLAEAGVSNPPYFFDAPCAFHQTVTQSNLTHASTDDRPVVESASQELNVKSELDLNRAPLLPWTYRHLNRFIRDASGRHLSASVRHCADVAPRMEGHAHNRKAARGMSPLEPVTAG